MAANISREDARRYRAIRKLDTIAAAHAPTNFALAMKATIAATRIAERCTRWPTAKDIQDA